MTKKIKAKRKRKRKENKVMEALLERLAHFTRKLIKSRSISNRSNVRKIKRKAT
jgi:hypothetical protein